MSMTESRSRELAPVDFDAIREAVMETPRGRWFLTEYSNRLNAGGTAGLLDSMKRLENAVVSHHEALMGRLAEALARGPAAAPPVAPQQDLAPKHMKFFKQDEEIFEPAPQASITVVKDIPKPDVPKGARVVIRRTSETVIPPQEMAPHPVQPPAPEAVETVLAEAAPKRRIVIIRHKSGETIDVPLQNEMAEAS